MNQLSVFPIPATIVNKLNAMIARFFWKNNAQIGIHWRAQKVIHQPKGKGGLGIRNVGTFNKALLMKKVWRIVQHPQLLFSKVFQSTTPLTEWIRSTRYKMSWG